MKTLYVLSVSLMLAFNFACDTHTGDLAEPSFAGMSQDLLPPNAALPSFSLQSTFSRGFGLNNAGVVAGSVKKPDGTIVAFTATGQNIWYSDEPVASDGLPVIRFSVNDRGEVAGHKIVPGGIAPVVWKKGQAHDLELLPGYQYGEVFDINTSGQMVGESLNGNYAAPTSYRATVFSLDGDAIDLGTLGGNIASAIGINDKGEIVGFAEATTPGQTRAFLYKDGSMSELGTLGGPWSNANAINNRSEIVGRSVLADGVSIRGFFWSDGQMTNIGTLGGNSSVAVDINDRSEVVGFSRISSGPFHAFLYKDGNMVDLGALLPGPDSRAMSINNKGDVTGYYTRPDGTIHAFLYQNGEMTEL
jgi:probable HAF family extracellular repeat protein